MNEAVPTVHLLYILHILYILYILHILYILYILHVRQTTIFVSSSASEPHPSDQNHAKRSTTTV